VGINSQSQGVGCGAIPAGTTTVPDPLNIHLENIAVVPSLPRKVTDGWKCSTSVMTGAGGSAVGTPLHVITPRTHQARFGPPALCLTLLRLLRVAGDSVALLGVPPLYLDDGYMREWCSGGQHAERCPAALCGAGAMSGLPHKPLRPMDLTKSAEMLPKLDGAPLPDWAKKSGGRMKKSESGSTLPAPLGGCPPPVPDPPPPSPPPSPTSLIGGGAHGHGLSPALGTPSSRQRCPTLLATRGCSCSPDLCRGGWVTHWSGNPP
jgi:hypothetical protein